MKPCKCGESSNLTLCNGELLCAKCMSNKIKSLAQSRGFHKEMHNHYESLFSLASNEAKFNLESSRYLIDVLMKIEDYIESGASIDDIAKLVSNTKERLAIDIEVHKKKLLK